MAKKPREHEPGSLADRLYALYVSNQRSIGHFDPRTGKMHTQYHAAMVQDFADHLSGKNGIGLVPILDDANCRWAAIDIDNHGEDEDIPIAPIANVIRDQHLPLIACRSKSGGVHAYLFLREPMTAAKVKSLMQRWARTLGYPNAEVFPKQSRLLPSKGQGGGLQLGNWINLPYLGGDETVRYALHGDKKLTTAEFVELAESKQAKEEDLTTALLVEHSQAPPCVQRMMIEGVSTGHRNEGLYNTVIYLKRAFPGDFEDRATDLNQTMFSKPLAQAECMRTINSAGRPDYSYRCGEEPIKSLCDKETCVKRKFGISSKEFDLLVTTQSLPTFSDLVKYLSEPIRWEISIDGVKVVNLMTEQILEWRNLRTIIAERLTRVVPLIKNNEWERVLHPLMQNVRIVEAPDDASVAGVIRERLREFAHKTDLFSHGKDVEERKALLRGLPCVQVIDGERCVVFRAQDLVLYLKRTKSEELKGVNLWFAVKEVGVLHSKIRCGEHNINVWFLPVSSVVGPSRERTEFKVDL